MEEYIKKEEQKKSHLTRGAWIEMKKKSKKSL